MFSACVSGVLVGVLWFAGAARPDATDGAMLSTPVRCWFTQGSTVPTYPVVGKGFPPSTTVILEYRYTQTSRYTQATSDPSGGFVARLPADGGVDGGSLYPVTRTVQAVGQSGSPVFAEMSVNLVERGFNRPQLMPEPETRRVLFRFAGFPGATIYAHYRFSVRGPSPGPGPHAAYHLVANARVGRTAGACGTLSVHRQPLRGVRVRPGYWKIQFDTSPQYHHATRNALNECLEIVESPRRRPIVNGGEC